MSNTCAKCNSEGSLYSDPTMGHVVCTACGFVSEEGTIVSEKDLEGTAFVGNKLLPRRGGITPDFQRHRSLGYRWTPVRRYSEGAREAATHFPRVLLSLGLPPGFSEEPLLILSKALSDREYWRTGRSSDILAGACVYLACKKQMKPISISDVASAIPCSVYDLGRIYKKLIDQLKTQGNQIIFPLRRGKSNDCDVNIEPYINRLCAKFFRNSITDPSNIEKLRKMSISIANLALLEFLLGAGRRLGSVIASSISLAAAVLCFSSKSKPLRDSSRKAPTKKRTRQHEETSSVEDDSNEAWNNDFKELCSSLHVSLSTVQNRFSELEDHFVKKARSLNVPWSNTITRPNLRYHIPFILQHFEFLAAASRVTPENKRKALLTAGGIVTKPPSFVLQEKRRAQRQAKITAAKERIAKYAVKKEKDNSIAATPVTPISIPSTPGLMAATPEFLFAIEGRLKSEEEDNDRENEEEEVGSEDSVIEQLLLEGVDEKTILDGYYESLLSDCIERKRRKLRASSEGGGEVWNGDSLELGEEDISESELNLFLRTPAEVEMMKTLPFFSSSFVTAALYPTKKEPMNIVSPVP
jgi:transcription initiation factor TFIIIB Brf1 subunit/transcription initiation factor TFIIB